MCSFTRALGLNIKNRIWILPFTMLIMAFSFGGYPYLYYHVFGPDRASVMWAPGTLSGVMAGICAVMLAYQGFSYLHYPHKVDMYHSLPVTIKQRFWFTYLCGMILFILSLVTGIVIGIIRSVVIQSNEHDFVISMYLRALLLILFFLCVYHICIYAFALTGHPAVGLLVTGVMIIYVDLWQKVFNLSLHLYAYAPFFAREGADISIIDLFFHTISGMDNRVPVGHGLTQYLRGVLGLLIWSLLLFKWCRKSYLRRPAEASKSLVIFYSSRLLIKTMIVVPFSLLMGEAVYENFYTYPYVMQGISMVIMAYVVSFITESLFSKSIRTGYRSVGSVIFSVVIIFMFFGVFRFWENRYNNYVPDKEDIESFALYNPLDSYYYNYNIEFSDEDEALWFIGAAKYVEDNMKLTDVDALMVLVNKSLKKDYRDMRSPLPLQIWYRLSDKTSRARLIWVDMDDSSNRTYLNRLMGPAYYKAGIWQAFVYDTPRDASIYGIEYHDLRGGAYRSLEADRINTLGLIRRWRKSMVMYDYDHVRYDEVAGEILVYFDDGFYRWVLPVYEDMYPVIFDSPDEEEP